MRNVVAVAAALLFLAAGAALGQTPPATPTTPTEPQLGGAVANPGYSPSVNPATAGNTITTADGISAQVYGTGLFTGAIAAARAVDRPDYVLQPGDQVAVHVYGAVNADTVQAIGSDGHLFLPGIGAVQAEGVTAGSLQSTLSTAIHRVYTSNVSVYTTVVVAGTLGVFVAGDVRRPGRYAGARGDSVLFFLDQAGGIDPARGSFRNVIVQRNGQTVARYDLYQFLLGGRIEPFKFEEGDVVFVAQRGAMVAATGATRNAFAFEAPQGSQTLTGADIMALARPEATTNSVALHGIRDGNPLAAYYAAKDFTSVVLRDGDHADFRSDTFSETITVTVHGDIKGPTTFVLPRNATLSQLLARISLEGTDVSPRYIHLQRAEVAAQQKAALAQSVYDLQKQVLTYSPITPETAQIQASQASLINQFAAQVNAAQPTGNVVVYTNGVFHDVRFKDGDVVVMPNKTDVVLVTGEVLAPGGFIAAPEESIRKYVARAGGFSPNANRHRVVVHHLDGSAEIAGPDTRPQPGDEVVIVPKVSGPYFQMIKDISTLVFQMALSVATVSKL